jgi:hypothetical protein
MSYVESEAMLNEIREMLSRYFSEKAQQEIDKLWVQELSTMPWWRVGRRNI